MERAEIQRLAHDAVTEWARGTGDKETAVEVVARYIDVAVRRALVDVRLDEAVDLLGDVLIKGTAPADLVRDWLDNRRRIEMRKEVA